MSDLLSSTTCLLICGESIDIELINRKLGFLPTSVTRQGDMVLPSVSEGASRNYDSRLKLDCWKKGLTSKQYKFDIVKQLEFWLEDLYQVRSSFRDFHKLGYWSVLDCQIASMDPQLPSIQFRLSKELQSKLAQLHVDLEFTIYRPSR